MADLSRAVGRFARTPILGWTGSAWVDTGLRGRLQVYDRFITEREFGQRKRILTLAGQHEAGIPYSLLKLQGSNLVYMLESTLEDHEDEQVYATSWSLHEAPYPAQLCRMATQTSRSGVKIADGEQVLSQLWVNLSRYSSVDSREFQNTDYTIYTVTFPRGTVLDTDMYLRLPGLGVTVDINEVFPAIDLPAARCLSRG